MTCSLQNVGDGLKQSSFTGAVNESIVGLHFGFALGLFDNGLVLQLFELISNPLGLLLVVNPEDDFATDPEEGS